MANSTPPHFVGEAIFLISQKLAFPSTDSTNHAENMGEPMIPLRFLIRRSD
jgi:hypothetical protein